MEETLQIVLRHNSIIKKKKLYDLVKAEYKGFDLIYNFCKSFRLFNWKSLFNLKLLYFNDLYVINIIKRQYIYSLNG